MAQDTKVSDLIINKGLTVEELSEKYAQGLIGDNELSIVDAEENVIQVDTMPVASADNVGSIVQYTGNDTQDYTNGYFYKSTVGERGPGSATVTQTVGAGIIDPVVNVATFEAMEQPTGDETVDFVASVVPGYVSPTSFDWGGVTLTVDSATFLQWLDDTTGGTIDWSIVNEIDVNHIVDNDTWNFWVFDSSLNELASQTNISKPQGFSLDGTPVNSYNAQMFYTPSAVTWSKDGSAVDLNDYGVSFSGYNALNTGDTLTVNYTAGVTTYSWENIEVQPASGGGITWTAFLDLPYPPQTLKARLKLGALPDGRYEFYTSTNMTASNNNNYMPMVFKVRLRLDRANNQTTLVANPVLGEGWISGGSQSLIKNGINRTYTLYYKSEDVNTLYFIPDTDGFLLTDIQQWYMTSADDGVGCFKATSVKNIETGEEYPTELEFSPNYTGLNSIYSHLECPLLVAEEAYRNASQSGWRIDQVNYVGIVLQYANTSYSGGLVNQTGVDISAVSGSDEFVCRVEFFPFDKMKVTVKKCTGAFIGTKVGTSSNYLNSIAIKPPVTFVDKDISVVWKIDSFSTSEYMSIWGLGTNDPFTEIGTFNVGSIIDPTNYGAIVQYDGQTDASYTNGYFYKATGTLVDIPGSVDCIEQNQDPDITISMDVDGFIAACSTIYGQESSEWWQYALDTNYYGWWWSYDMTNNLIYWDCYGWLDASLTQYFTISTTQDFTFGTYNYVPKTQEVQGGAWTRTDVQPAPVIPDPLPSQTGNAGKFLTTDGINASWGNALVNKAINSSSIVINEGTDTGSSTDGVVLGKSAYASGNGGVSVGANSSTSGGKSIAIGRKATASARCSIQLGYNATNSDVDTFKVANGNGNFEMMSANGTIPTDRFTTTPVADGTYVPTLTISSGTATRSWAAPSSGGGTPTLTWYTVSSAGSTLTIADTSSANLVKIYKNGLLLEPTADYSISGTTLTMVTALVVGDKITTEVF